MLWFSFYIRNLCCDWNFLYFINLYLPRSCFVLVVYNKTNIPCLFLFNIKTIHSQYYNILGWIVSDIKQRGMEYLLNISGNILELIPNKINSEIENQPPKKVKLTKVNARRKPSLIALR